MFNPNRLKLLALLLVTTLLVACNLRSPEAPVHPAAPEWDTATALEFGDELEETSEPIYEDLDRMMADIMGQLHQPNIRKEDILRGWYMGAKSDKKYGTPTTWIFIEDGDQSKWISPNAIEEVELVSDRALCKETAGHYSASCLETTDAECEYVGESICHCPDLTKWKDGQGCIMTTEKGSYVSINRAELSDGYYFGLPNQKKLNTPAEWTWKEAGRESVWTKTKN